VVHNMVERAIAMEGTVTGEHGVGVIKRDYLEKELGPAAVDLMRQVSCEVPEPERGGARLTPPTPDQGCLGSAVSSQL